jgi:energy-coupling factor transporter transmembrane protein EcfT
MVSRGYTGASSLFSYSSRPLKKKDIVICIIVIAAVVAIDLLSYNII